MHDTHSLTHALTHALAFPRTHKGSHLATAIWLSSSVVILDWSSGPGHRYCCTSMQVLSRYRVHVNILDICKHYTLSRFHTHVNSVTNPTSVSIAPTIIHHPRVSTKHNRDDSVQFPNRTHLRVLAKTHLVSRRLTMMFWLVWILQRVDEYQA